MNFSSLITFKILILTQILIILLASSIYSSMGGTKLGRRSPSWAVFALKNGNGANEDLLGEIFQLPLERFTLFLHKNYSISTRLLPLANGVLTENILNYREKLAITRQASSVNSGIRFLSQAITSGEETLFHFKQFGIAQTRSFLGKPAGNFYAQLVFGKLAEADNKLQPLFALTGMQYILVVSGFHLNLLIRAVTASLQSRVANWQVAFLAIAVAMAYHVVVGYSPSLFRAAVMSCAAIAARYVFFRQHRASYFFVLMIVVLCLMYREKIENVSFQLSAAATAGIIYLMPFFTRVDSVMASIERAEISGGSLRGSLLAKYFALTKESFWISVSVNLALLPLLLYYFGEVNLVSIGISSLFFWMASLLVAGSWLLLALAAAASANNLLHQLLLPGRELAYYFMDLVELILGSFAKLPLIVAAEKFEPIYIFLWWSVLVGYVVIRSQIAARKRGYQRLAL